MSRVLSILRIESNKIKVIIVIIKRLFFKLVAKQEKKLLRSYYLADNFKF